MYNSGGTLHMEGSATVTANMARTGGGIANVGSEGSALTAILGLAAVTENRSQASGGGLYNAGAAAVVRLTGQAAVARQSVSGRRRRRLQPAGRHPHSGSGGRRDQ